MIRRTGGSRGDSRSSALWGTGSRGEKRARTGGAGRGVAAVGAALLALTLPALAAAAKPAPKDTTAPVTSITSGPVAGSTVNSSTVTIGFAANEPSTFRCSFDGGAFGACTGATSHTMTGLANGVHQFAVRATDLAGNVDTRGASVSWYTPYISTHTYLQGSLQAQAQAHPDQIFPVIIQLRTQSSVDTVRGAAKKRKEKGKFANQTTVSDAFTSISGFPAKLTGSVILYLADNYPSIESITLDAPVRLSDFHPEQVWPATIKADQLWPGGANALPAGMAVPTIAVVDSGIDDKRADFAGRVVGHVNLQSDVTDATNLDDYGHGTFVADMAAGAADTVPGVAPTAKLYDVRVIGKDGSANTSDVIRGADWILANKDTYGIKVANFSLHAGNPSSFKFDPLDKAVENLWFAGVTVVAASGNFGDGTPQHMVYAPGNDPFVITVGAADTHGTVTPADDDIAYWSAYGPTADGFAKPELSAPGRYMIGAVPTTATLYGERPDHVVSDGYMQLSGTSFASPVVAGAAAELLALHPNWTPDQVKGALMVTASPLPAVANPFQSGVGEIDLAAAAELGQAPNANQALDAFVTPDSANPVGRSFDDASWASAATADASWASASWASASWASASWSDASWASASWSDASQADAAMSDASWSDASWSDASWTD